MKILPLSFSLGTLLLLSSCIHENASLEIHPEDRIVNISLGDGYSIGKGVYIDSDTILTAAHVVSKDQKYRISKEGEKPTNKRTIREILVSTGSDIARILLMNDASVMSKYETSCSMIGTKQDFSCRRNDEKYGSSDLNTPIYALVSRSGSWIRIDGKILSKDASYIGYDATLSGKVFTGALETDIVLLPGESGTPIWTLSGELLGVMSAVNADLRRGYIAN